MVGQASCLPSLEIVDLPVSSILSIWWREMGSLVKISSLPGNTLFSLRYVSLFLGPAETAVSEPDSQSVDKQTFWVQLLLLAQAQLTMRMR